MTHLRYRRWNILLLIFSIFISAVSAEICFRAAGFPVWETASPMFPLTIKPDDRIGWRNIPNLKIQIPREGSVIHYTTLEDGSRATSENRNESASRYMFFGCSFTNGTRALSDEETYTWQFQKKHPEISVSNFGTEAYSPYQSLLLLDEELKLKPSPTMVFFGFVNFHESRNVANPGWLKMLAQANKFPPKLPFVTVDTNEVLIEHAGIQYPWIPLREDSAIMNRMGEVLANSGAEARVEQSVTVMQKVLRQMQNKVEEAGAKFKLVFLHSHNESPDRYLQLFQKWQFPYIDCTLPENINMDEYVIRGDGHPNGKANSFWADCIANQIQLNSSR